jgi:hypothetical protein
MDPRINRSPHVIEDFDFSKGGSSSAPTPKTLFGLLSEGRTIGKRIKIVAPESIPGESYRRAGDQNILQVGSSDNAAQQLCITIIPPGVIPQSQFPGGVLPSANSSAIDSASGDRDNYSLYTSPDPANDFKWTNSEILVEWGIGGVQSKVECDVLNGLVLNICASWVRVSAFLDAVNSGNGVSGCVDFLGAYVGPGFPKANNAQRTFNVGILSALSNIGYRGFPFKGFGNLINTDPSLPPLNASRNAYPIPYMAKQATVICRGEVGLGIVEDTWDVSIQFFRDVRTSELMGSFRFTQDIHEPVRIPNGAYYWTLHNHQNVEIANSSAVFDLAV